MQKCSACSKEYPESMFKQMVQIVGNKAYLQAICPACQPVINNNPNYYILMEDKKTNYNLTPFDLRHTLD